MTTETTAAPTTTREDFNAASSWRATTFRVRWQICKLAGFDRPADVADVSSWFGLHEAQQEIIRNIVRKHISELPRSAWGLA
jgi:predicted NUDIX family NTP pyrophosphohydrolase